MREPAPDWSAEQQSSWRRASELLQAGRYEQLADLVRDTQLASERSGDRLNIQALAFAARICQACRQSQTEAQWHQQAHAEASQREQELKQQLQTLFDMLAGERLSQTPGGLAGGTSPPAPDLAEPVESPSLWQRIQALLGRGPGPRSPEREAPVAPAEVLIVPPGEKAEESAASPVVKQEKWHLPSLVVYCLGPFRAYQDDQLIEKWPGHKSKRILKYMIIHRERPIHQEILMDLFWRDADPEAARRNLYQAIYTLRQTLQMGITDFPYILCEDGCYHLNPEVEVWVDCEAFRMHEQDGRRLEQAGHLPEAMEAYELAENLYEGEFLAEDLYEDWTVVHRENLKHAHLDILDRLSQHYFDQGQLSMAISFCQKILAEDNCREDAHRRLMRCHVYQGQRHLALRQYHLCVEALKRELDVPPMPATIELHQQILTNRAQFPSSRELRGD